MGLTRPKAKGTGQRAEVSNLLTRVILTFALCLLPFALWLSAQTQRPPIFRAGAVLVTVDAYPQKDGKIVEGLSADDFEILEDGKPQKVETFDFVRVEPALSDDARRDPNTVGEANTLAADPRNRVFVAYLDVYHVDYSGSHAARQPLVDGLNRMLAPNDLFGVMTPKMRARDVTFGRKLQSIEDQLTKNWPWGARFAMSNEPEEDALRYCLPTSWTPEHQDQVLWLLRQRRREDLTLTSLEDLVRYLPGLREARTDVLMFTDGWALFERDQALADIPSANGPSLPGVYVGPAGQMTSQIGARDQASCSNEIVRLANLDDARRFRDLLTEASRRNITFYPINPGGLAVFDTPIALPMGVKPGSLTADAASLRNRVDSLRTLAENTDGIAVVQANDLMAGMRRIADDVSAYYLMGYYSTNTKFTGGFRKIQVRMKRLGMTVKARRGYFAPDESKPAAVSAPAPAASVGVPVTEALAVLGRLRPSAELFSSGAVAGGELLLTAEIASGLMASGKWAQGGEVQATVSGADGAPAVTARGKIEPGTRGALIHVPIGASANGPWQVVFKVTGAGDPIEDRAMVTRAPTTPLLGDPVIYRAAPGPRAPLQPAADFQFRRTERVHIEWPMLKPFDDRQARLLSRTGQPLAVSVTLTTRADSRSPREESESGLRGASARLAEASAEAASSAAARASGGGAPLAVNIDGMLTVDVNLAPLAAGDYVIEVTAGTGADAERKLIAIRVVQ